MPADRTTEASLDSTVGKKRERRGWEDRDFGPKFLAGDEMFACGRIR